MNNFDNNQVRARINSDDFIGGRYLKVADVDKPTPVTIVDAWTEMKRERDGGERLKIVIKFKEFRKPLIMNTERTQELKAIFGTKYADEWRGTVVLYVKPDVFHDGVQKGGLRFKPLNGAAASEGNVEKEYAG